MEAATILRHARRKLGLSQRDLAERTGIAQPAIARIESGRVIPRIDTIERLLEGCGKSLELVPVRGIGVDRTQIRQLLALSPAQRLGLAGEAANNLLELVAKATRG